MRVRDLQRMKAIALGLLAVAAAVYIVASLLHDRHPAWGYVAAFSEAAMVGAIADWFAVVALFRHPLGLPIPHTAIIPSNKDRIGAKLAGFICNNFLSTEQVLAKLRQFDAAGRLANPRLDHHCAGDRHDAVRRDSGHNRRLRESVPHDAVRTIV